MVVVAPLVAGLELVLVVVVVAPLVAGLQLVVVDRWSGRRCN